jgi:RNA polymerase sigma-70 factor (ECF subfamily)
VTKDLTALVTIAEQAVPTVKIAPAAFGAWLERSEHGRALLASFASDGASDGAGDGASEVPTDATRVRVAELWLACAIESGDEAAARELDARFVAPLGETLARMRLDDAELDDVKQIVREKLLVRDANGHARISEYAGQGRMAGLVQVIATREALSRIRRGKRDVNDANVANDANHDRRDLDAPLAAAVDPGLEALKGKYRAAFRAAFADAVATLSPKERNLLRMHLLGGVTLEQLAAIHGVHRASIVRWLKDARDTVLTKTKASLAHIMNVRADELESLHALAESRLDASIERLLMTNDPAADTRNDES